MMLKNQDRVGSVLCIVNKLEVVVGCKGGSLYGIYALQAILMLLN